MPHTAAARLQLGRQGGELELRGGVGDPPPVIDERADAVRPREIGVGQCVMVAILIVLARGDR